MENICRSVHRIFEDLRIIVGSHKLARSIDNAYEEAIMETIEAFPAHILHRLNEMITGVSIMLRHVNIYAIFTDISSADFPHLSALIKSTVTTFDSKKFVSESLQSSSIDEAQRKLVEMFIRRLNAFFKVIDFIAANPDLLRTYILDMYKPGEDIFG